jgi:YaiO family outer membrane protein
MKRFRISSILLALLGTLPLSAATVDDGLAAKKAKDFPAAERAFSEVIAAEPKQAQAWAERATVRGWQKKYQAAIGDWQQALALEPNNSEFHVGLARVQLWKGDRQAAMSALDRALLLTPRDPALWELKGDIARDDHNRPLALTAYREADRLDHGDRAARIGDVPWDATAWRIDLVGVRDRYSNDRTIESTFTASLGYRHVSEGEDDHEWYATTGVAQLNHYQQHDLTVGAETGYRLYPRLLLRATGTYTPDADFEPNWRVGGGCDVALFTPTSFFMPVTLLFDLQHSQYNDNDQQVLVATPGIRIEPHRLVTLEGRYITSTNHVGAPVSATEHTAAWQGRMYLNIGQVHPFVGYAQGEEPDPPQPTTYGRSLWGGMIFDLDRNLSLRLEGAYEDRETYNRMSLGGGVILRF